MSSFLRVRLAAHVSNGLKSRIHPVVGRIQPKARVSIVRWNLKEAGCEEHTNSWANLWSDGQKSYMRLCMRVRLHAKSKPNNYTECLKIKRRILRRMTSFGRTKVKKTSKSIQIYRIWKSPFSKGLQGYTRVSLSVKKIPDNEVLRWCK